MTVEEQERQDYTHFFRTATGHEPYPYQIRLGQEPWPKLLDIPTGMGKTAGVALAWAWKRGLRPGGEPEKPDAYTPRRLVWCLPMRVLVEQTFRAIQLWLTSLGHLGQPGNGKVSVHLLLGGADDTQSWSEHPEEDMILIGTQDMLLSRALMRGYGMSRYLWPVHFAFLHNDALWVLDEVQLMGSGLPTSAQLEAFRRELPTGLPARSLWMSATLNPAWLATVDFKPYLTALPPQGLSETERTSGEIRRRREAVKRLSPADVRLTADNVKGGATAYAKALAEEVIRQHQPGTQTVVIVNTVERAQAVFEAVGKLNPAADRLLVHARFRQNERSDRNARLSERIASDHPGRILVATQAIEAGVDLTSRVLFTELAPWSALVQRLGRCNRYGEWNDAGGADVLWIDVEAGLSSPYEDEPLNVARQMLRDLDSASPARLPPTTEAAPVLPVLRRRDFLDLFNTDPDLSGFDVDIAPYIRDADDLEAQVFWRDLSGGIADQPQPRREELCRASLSMLKRYLDRRKNRPAAWRWDSLSGKWIPFREGTRPGLTLMLDARLGGYDSELGFIPEGTKPVSSLTPASKDEAAEAYDGDHRSRQAQPVGLAMHLLDVEHDAETLADALDLPVEYKAVLALAGRWHDVGKAHPVFQATMHGVKPEDIMRITEPDWSGAAFPPQTHPLLAKSPFTGRHARPHFRHELASMLAWLEIHGLTDADKSWPAFHQHDWPDGEASHSLSLDTDLIAYLILAHHGKVRTSLRAMPEELEPHEPYGPRYARGVWEREGWASAFTIGDADTVAPVRFRLDLMELGEGNMGPSWTARVLRLLDVHGPFRLAWLEALVRVADWRASAWRQHFEKGKEQ